METEMETEMENERVLDGLEHLMSREELQKLQCFQSVTDPGAARHG
jgi:hypothetical protein